MHPHLLHLVSNYISLDPDIFWFLFEKGTDGIHLFCAISCNKTIRPLMQKIKQPCMKELFLGANVIQKPFYDLLFTQEVGVGDAAGPVLSSIRFKNTLFMPKGN
ncbi:hypothetical protein ATANTOWER_013504 [Ataeniobius toweri]|uniref:Uncharacterized protein n=1 Tax=Ataeniobius toweri TaxID=208326 RepID=A0ABU7ARZ2_9TELE|nr:hypothetical protein [Ataeniobius toweri]